jgi:hypothetical protein
MKSLLQDGGSASLLLLCSIPAAVQIDPNGGKVAELNDNPTQHTPIAGHDSEQFLPASCYTKST